MVKRAADDPPGQELAAHLAEITAIAGPDGAMRIESMRD